MNYTFPAIMGIINVTPDSFSDGGLYTEHQSAIAHACRLIEQGADIIDIQDRARISFPLMKRSIVRFQ